MGYTPDMYPCEDCGGARDGPPCECKWGDEVNMEIRDWLHHLKKLTEFLPEVKKEVKLTTEIVLMDSTHNCGREDCGVKRNKNNELYWCKLVCGHGYWPCGSCSYPIHPDGPCPRTGEESWVATTPAANWVCAQAAIAVCWEIYAARNEGDGYCGENRYDDSRNPRQNAFWRMLRKTEHWLEGPNERDEWWVTEATQGNYDCSTFDTPRYGITGTWGAWATNLSSAPLYLRLATEAETWPDHEELMRRVISEALLPSLLEGQWIPQSPYKKRPL